MVSPAEKLVLFIIAFASWIIYLDKHPYELPSPASHELFDGYSTFSTVVENLDPTSSLEVFERVRKTFDDGVKRRDGWTGPLRNPNAYQILDVDYSASRKVMHNAQRALHKNFAPKGVVDDRNRDTVKAVLWAWEMLRTDYGQCLYDAHIGNRGGPWEGLKSPCERIWEIKAGAKRRLKEETSWKNGGVSWGERRRLLAEFDKAEDNRLRSRSDDIVQDTHDERYERMLRDEMDVEESGRIGIDAL